MLDSVSQQWDGLLRCKTPSVVEMVRCLCRRVKSMKVCVETSTPRLRRLWRLRGGQRRQRARAVPVELRVDRGARRMAPPQELCVPLHLRLRHGAVCGMRGLCIDDKCEVAAGSGVLYSSKHLREEGQRQGQDQTGLVALASDRAPGRSSTGAASPRLPERTRGAAAGWHAASRRSSPGGWAS